MSEADVTQSAIGVAIDQAYTPAAVDAAESSDTLALFGTNVALGPQHPHGSNIVKKAGDVRGHEKLGPLIHEIAQGYLAWRKEALAISCPDIHTPTEFILKQVDLYQSYRDVLDDPAVDAFDSRGALQPSALEEFCYFLLRPLFLDAEDQLALGHHEVFQGLYFTAPNFIAFTDIPTPNYPVGNLDFVIGKRLEASIKSATSGTATSIVVPAVAIECKTYLDRPRWIESDILAASIKRGFPGCLYILLSEFLKLDLTKVNVLGSQIDNVYVLRRAKNVDRKIRRASGTGLKPIHAPAVENLFCVVRDHLSNDWVSPESWEDSGILK